MKILVVEDEKISRLYLSNIASLYGQCDVAEDGKVAIEKIKKSFEENERYNVVFLDIMLPKITGHVVLELLRAYEADYEVSKQNRTTIIMTSAFKDSDNIKKAYDNLVDIYLAKPILKKQIEDIFKKLIN